MYFQKFIVIIINMITTVKVKIINSLLISLLIKIIK
jgi:hypothetical protein